MGSIYRDKIPKFSFVYFWFESFKFLCLALICAWTMVMIFDLFVISSVEYVFDIFVFTLTHLNCSIPFFYDLFIIRRRVWYLNLRYFRLLRDWLVAFDLLSAFAWTSPCTYIYICIINVSDGYALSTISACFRCVHVCVCYFWYHPLYISGCMNIDLVHCGMVLVAFVPMLLLNLVPFCFALEVWLDLHVYISCCQVVHICVCTFSWGWCTFVCSVPCSCLVSCWFESS